MILPTISLGIIGARFYRVAISVALGLAVLATLLTKGTNPYLIAFSAMTFATVVLSNSDRLLAFLSYTLAAAGLLLIPISLAGDLLTSLLGILSAVLLGSSTLSMMLGHSFLANARLPFEILIKSCLILTAAIIVRVVSSVIWFDTGKLITVGSKDQLLLVIAAVRFSAGILFALIMTLMALSCARIRSNQSATGILYVIVGFVLVGEMIACYFTHSMAIYL